MQKRSKTGIPIVPVLALITLLTGCSTFNSEWRAAAKQPPSSGSIEGAWDGSWKSNHNGHNGSLRAIITKLDDNTYEARFRAKYMKILSFSQVTRLTSTITDSVHEFEGQNDLGKAYGGIYYYEGNATPDRFFSTYKCSIDHGTFQMTRPK